MLEGVAFALRDSFEVARSMGLSLESAKICGGGAKSALWKKIIANVLNIKLEVLETVEGPSYGAAILAMVASGEYANVAEASKKFTRIKECIEPEKALVKAPEYNVQYNQQLPDMAVICHHKNYSLLYNSNMPMS